MKRFIFCLGCLLILFSSTVFAQTVIEGSWRGELKLPTATLPIIFHIDQQKDGYAATMDSPSQGASGIEVSQVTIEEDTLLLKVAAINGHFKGRIVDNRNIKGQWVQNNYTFPLDLVKTKEELSMNRPQEPKPPFSYTIENIKFDNTQDTVSLAGTLTIPQGKGPFPAVVLVSGSGPQDRDETLMGHKPFWVLADYLTKKGFAVLRYDDRGFGESGGDFKKATTLNFAADASAAVDFLSQRKNIKKESIGIIGHSEGGLAAGLAAKRNPKVNYLLMWATPAIPGKDILITQGKVIQEASGVPAPVIELNQKNQKAILEAVLQKKEDSVKRKEIIALLEAPYAGLSDQQKKQANYSEIQIKAQANQLLSPWFQYFLVYDPLTTVQQLSIPILYLYGGKDLQVPADVNTQALEQKLKNKKNVKVQTLENLNHLFQTANTGLPHEYSTTEETINPQALEIMANWLKKQAK